MDKRIILAVLAFFCGVLTYAQQFTTHAVKEGETIYGIAQKYKVTPYNLYKYNKELKKDVPLQPNTLLIIPLDAPVSDTTEEVKPDIRNIIQEDSILKAPEPISFRTHKVRKRETIYGISQRYGILEEDLKRYNTYLYANPLKKGMRLQIPIFPEETEAESAYDPDNYEVYTVKPKETRWSIAHKYGITLDSLMVLNPDLPKTTSHLAIGQELLLPKPLGSTIEDQETQIYVSYTVPAKKTLYSLGQEYGVDPSEIVRLNPEIMEVGGLKEGMLIRLPEQKITAGEVNTENYVFYEVKPKQTVYSLTRKLGLTYNELIELNPDVQQGLKAGMVLKLPVDKTDELDVKNSLVLDEISLIDSVDIALKPRLMFLLPFRLDRLDLSDPENAAVSLERSNAIKYSLGLYSGALVAIDSIAEMGVSVDIKTYDTELKLAKIQQILNQEDISQYNAIIGPLQLDALKEVAVKAHSEQVPVIAPLASRSEVNLENVFYSVPPDSVLRVNMLRYMKEVVTDQNIIVIADSKNAEAEQQIIQEFPTATSIDLIEEEENISIDLESFNTFLSLEKENWVFVETNNFKIVSSVSSILNSSNSDTTKIRMFTTNKNRAFDNDVISGVHLSNLNFTYPSVDREFRSDAFRRRYRRRFGGDPDRYAVRGFDLTFDLLLKLAYRIDLFEVSETIGTTEYTANKFDYLKELGSSYYNSALYIMMLDDMRINQLKSYP